MTESASDWLDQQCRRIDAIRSGAMLLSDDTADSQNPRVIMWPHDSEVDPRLLKIARSAMTSNEPQWETVDRTGGESGNSTVVAYPLTLHGQVQGAVTIEYDGDSETMRQSAIHTLQNASARLMASKANGPPSVVQQVQSGFVDEPLQRHAKMQAQLLSLLVEAVDHESFRSACNGIANEVLQQFDCRRVSLGLLHRDRLQVSAISNNANFDEKTSPVRSLALAMNESISQQRIITIPADARDNPELTRAHRTLVNEQDSATVCTVPLIAHEEVVGAILLERNENSPFDSDTEQQLEQASLLISPVLDMKRQLELPVREKVRNSIRNALIATFGARYLLGKCLGSLLVLLVLFLVTVTDEYVVTADATLQPTTKFAVTSPFDGFIARSYRKVGDFVRTGETLLELDQREIELEIVKWRGEHAKLTKEYRSALARRDRTEVRILKNRQDQVQIELQRLKTLIERSKLVSPINGIIIHGDLDEVGGSPVERGQLLFEIAELDEYRVELKVDERDIAGIRSGQIGKLLLTSLPDEPVEIQITNIVPVSQGDEGINAFMVYADLLGATAVARPGMQGVAKIELGTRRMIWIHTHKIWDWMRLQWWRLGW